MKKAGIGLTSVGATNLKAKQGRERADRTELTDD